MRRATKITIAFLALALTAYGCFHAPLRLPDPATNPDYASQDAWLCRPDMNGDACDIDLTAVEVFPDNTTKLVPFAPATNPTVDCFYVYPTVDLGLRPGQHEDLTDKEDPIKTAGIQAARFAEVCRVYAPLYRQVRLGTYSADKKTRDFFLDSAYRDVEAAFHHYLAHDNGGRPFVLISHSQGSHMISRLIRRKIEKDPAILDKLVVALAIGGTLGTDKGGRTGGSFDHVPVCSSKEEQGCVVGYRSYQPGATNFQRDESLVEGDIAVCVHPANPGSHETAPLSRAYFPTRLRRFGNVPDNIAEQAPFVLYRNFYEAQCVDRGKVRPFEVRERKTSGDARKNPVDFDTVLTRSALGLHIYDMQFGMGDMIDLVRIKAEARARTPTP